jgi:hypothetical protein
MPALQLRSVNKVVAEIKTVPYLEGQDGNRNIVDPNKILPGFSQSLP